VLFAAGCDYIPRGAGLQSEVLAVSSDADAIPDIAVEPVTRNNLATFHSWAPASYEHYSWIDRVDQPNTRIIRPGDTLRATIWTTEDNGLLTASGQRNITLPDLRVSSSGKVFLPYVGEFRVSGMSPENARGRIEAAYLDSIPSAQVQIEMIEGRAQAVSLVSGVSAPGSFPLPDSDFTILELIALGGGISDSLTNPQVRLHRNGQIYGISAERLFDAPSTDTTLVGGDRIFVEADDRTFLSLGAAGSEAVHSFPTDTVTALEALSIIGGVAEGRADAKGILILRSYPVRVVTADRSGPDHPRTVFTLDLTTADGLFSADQFLIQPGDLIYVTESPLTAVSSILGLIGTIFGLATQVTK
jgi:polysaccharide export outer membrane protein